MCPRVVKAMVPAGIFLIVIVDVLDCLFLWEEAWNAHPHCLTVMTNGYFSIDKFKIAVESHYKDDKGTTENILEMPENELKVREVIFMDIAEKTPKDELPLDEVEVDEYDIINRMSLFSTAKSAILVLWLPSGMKIWVFFSWWM